MARVCTVCTHNQRAVIDRIIAQGSLSNRAIASQFGLNRGAIDRHSDHLKDSVVKAAQAKAQKHVETVTGDWATRLESMYSAAADGVARAATDPDKWYMGASFIGQAVKAIDVGMRASGEIAGSGTTVNIGHMLVMPHSAANAPQSLSSDQRKALPSPIIDAEPIDD